MLFFYVDAADEERPPHKYARLNGVMVEYIQKDGISRAVRIHSCDPTDYLKPELYPGADITHLIP